MRTSIGTAAAGVMMVLAAQASAAPTPGEQFVFDWTETSGSHVGLTGTVDFALGAAATTPGFFTLTSFTVTQSGGFCGICTPLTENLSGELFDSTSGGLQGEVTGSYKNTKGKTHTFDLTTMDLPGGTWTFDDTGPGGTTTVTMGTYKTTASTSVPEPATVALLGLGLLGVGLSRRRLAR
jgi:hypothetical protein